MSERRRLARLYPGQIEASIRKRGLLASLTSANPCEVLDFNRAGMALVSTLSLAPQTEVLIDLELPGVGALRVSGTVRHTNPLDFDRYRMGVEFDPFAQGAAHNTPQCRDTLLKIEEALSPTSAARS